MDLLCFSFQFGIHPGLNKVEFAGNQLGLQARPSQVQSQQENWKRVQDKKVTELGLSQFDWWEVEIGLRYCSQNKLK